MKTVITYGTFDLFHIGHVNLLKRARSLGDRLVVAISTDEHRIRPLKTLPRKKSCRKKGLHASPQ